jgi:hypothetical protein
MVYYLEIFFNTFRKGQKMNKDRMKQKMIEVCDRNIIQKSRLGLKNCDLVFEEPYIPYIPDNWNGFLILAEVQNLTSVSGENRAYIAMLGNGDKEYRIKRLGEYPPSYANKIGVGPWDDNSLKLAFASVFGNGSIDQVAVSNAILWSVVDKNEKTPSSKLKGEPEFKELSTKLESRSRDVWKEFIKIMEPKYIIAAGKVAHELIKKAIQKNFKGKCIEWAHPAFIRRTSFLFDEYDLLKRYPEVNEAIKRIKLNEHEGFRNKVFYACHCVSKNYKSNSLTQP